MRKEMQEDFFLEVFSWRDIEHPDALDGNNYLLPLVYAEGGVGKVSVATMCNFTDALCN